MMLVNLARQNLLFLKVLKDLNPTLTHSQLKTLAYMNLPLHLAYLKLSVHLTYLELFTIHPMALPYMTRTLLKLVKSLPMNLL